MVTPTPGGVRIFCHELDVDKMVKTDDRFFLHVEWDRFNMSGLEGAVAATEGHSECVNCDRVRFIPDDDFICAECRDKREVDLNRHPWRRRLRRRLRERSGRN